MENYWVPDDELVWAPCMLTSTTAEGATFENGSGGKIVIPKAKADTLDKVSPAQLQGVDNMCKLDSVNAGALLHTVRTRYQDKDIYTRVARILIAVNPFEPLSIYSAEHIDRYMKANDSLDMDPHVYGVGLDAVNGLRQGNGKNQAVLISGESGAGKTESTKLVLSFMTEAIAGSGGIQDRIMQTNPILEAFGNAMTVRNNNSSRFGKWLEMSISPSISIVGCSITDYLLERTRVCVQGAKERNYHIFFQVVQARNSPELANLGILDVEKYRYLNGGQKVAPGIDDASFFEEVKEAFNTLGFSADKQTEVFKVIVGVLSLGNIEFKDAGEKAAIVDEAPVQKTSEMLGFTTDALVAAMTTKKLQVGKEVTITPLSMSGACAARDGFSRLLYGRLFKWLIKKVNSNLHEGGSSSEFFGVLDIAGFESFEHNSLEQLFINLSNEHLQQHFNNHIFKMELEDYAREGVSAGDGLSFQDNSDVVDLVGAANTGILSILDEEGVFAKATDETFVSKVCKAHEKHPRLVVPKFAGSAKFGVRHFAGEVTYSCEGFLEKNADKPPEDSPALLASSTMTVLKDMGASVQKELDAIAEEQMNRRGSQASKKKPKTLGSAFRTSLVKLMEKLGQAEPHFIRCVKPNAEKVPHKFTSRIVMEQLTFSGIMEAVRIRQQGYASRQIFRDFCGRYKCVLPKTAQHKLFGPGSPQDADRARAMLEALTAAVTVKELNRADFVVGKTKVLAKVSGVTILDKCRDIALSGYALDIQRIRRGLVVRRKMKGVKEVFNNIAVWVKKNKFYSQPGSAHTALATLKNPEAIDKEVATIQELFAIAQDLPMGVPDKAKIQKVRQKMESEAAMARQLQALQTSVDAVEIGKSLARAKDLEIDNCAEAKNLIGRVAKLKMQIPLVQAMKDALESGNVEQLTECMEEVKKEGLNLRPENWISELKAEELAGRVYDETERRKASKKLADIEAKRKKECDEVVEKEREATKTLATRATFVAEEPRPSTRKTITGMSEKSQQKLLMALAAACHEFDAIELEAQLGEATRAGIDAEKLADSTDMMNNLQTEAFLVQTIEQMQEEVLSATPGAHALKCLQNLVSQAKRLDVAQETVEKARPVMQQGVRRRARSTVNGSFFEHVDMTELQFGEEVFSDLANFQNLKPMAKWKGHRTGAIFSRRASNAGSGDKPMMLCHSKQEIKEALTKVASSQEMRAVQQYRNVLGWMSDRPVPEVQRLGFAQDIVDAAKSGPAMGDEVYVQVMKQLTKNPSRRSLLLGWKLFLQLCQNVCPSEELEEFVRSFLMVSLRSNQEIGFDEAVSTCKQCVADLNQNVKSEEHRFSGHIIPVQVLLIDNSTRKIYIEESATLKALGERVSESLKIHNGKDFSFFQMTDGLDTHRLLPEQTVLSTLSEKWKKLKEVTQRASRLLWKRRFMRVDETLQAGDLIHATLTYRQALWDYHHYPITEDVKFMTEIASTILWLEQDHYAEYIKTSRLSDPSILEQLLPEIALRHQKRNKWSQQVQESFLKLQKNLGAEETRLQQMSRLLSHLQRMKLFGAYFWLGRQTYQVPKEKQSLPDGKAPTQMCKINPKEPEAEYWICVDLYGVRFVSVDSAPGTEFQRGFLFNDEAVERVLCWGAKQNIVQFVVQSVNPAFPAAGRVPMSIALISPAAIDIAYAVHTISHDRKRQKS